MSNSIKHEQRDYSSMPKDTTLNGIGSITEIACIKEPKKTQFQSQSTMDITAGDSIEVAKSADQEGILRFAKAYHFIFEKYQKYYKTQHLEKATNQRKTAFKGYKDQSIRENNLEFWVSRICRVYDIYSFDCNWNPSVVLTYSYILFKRLFARCLNSKRIKAPGIEKIYKFFIICLDMSIKMIYDYLDEIIHFGEDIQTIFFQGNFDLKKLQLELILDYFNFDQLFIHPEDLKYETESINLLF